jgi:hypothetical protein
VRPRRLSDLEPDRRRRVLVRTVVSIDGMWAASLTIYYLAPVGREAARTDVARHAEQDSPGGRYSIGLRPSATGAIRWRIYKAGDADHVVAIGRTFG